MSARDERVDAYIASSAEFARPILKQLREVVHKACPAVEEDIKWGMPHFMYKGMLCGMASFKAHCSFGFWKGSLVFNGEKPPADEKAAMGHLGCIRTLDDLPSKAALTRYVKKAAELNDAGVKIPGRARRKPAGKQAALKVPADLASALSRNAKARRTFDGFTYSHRKEYVNWVASAKRDETRAKRLTTAVRQMSEGKSLHWKYR
jgi:uncharacterized protein YdeI (YjbR/CyaY-like superfamily)